MLLWIWVHSKYLFESLLLHLLAIYPGVGLLSHVVILFSIFRRNCHCHTIPSIMATAILHSYQQCTELVFFHIPCQYLLILFLLLNSHSNKHEMVSHCGFALCSPNSHLFTCLSVIYLSSLEKSFVHFLNWVFPLKNDSCSIRLMFGLEII